MENSSVFSWDPWDPSKMPYISHRVSSGILFNQGTWLTWYPTAKIMGSTPLALPEHLGCFFSHKNPPGFFVKTPGIFWVEPKIVFVSLFSTTFYTRVCYFLNSWWFKAGLFELYWIPKKNWKLNGSHGFQAQAMVSGSPKPPKYPGVVGSSVSRKKPTASSPLKTGDKLGETFPFAFTTIFRGKLFVSGYVSFLGWVSPRCFFWGGSSMYLCPAFNVDDICCGLAGTIVYTPGQDNRHFTYLCM